MKILLLLATALPFIVCGEFIAGGRHPYNAQLTDPIVMFAVQGVNNYYSANGDTKPRILKQIKSASTQVVAGIIYRFKLILSGGYTNEVCNIEVWSRQWLKDDQKLVIHGVPDCVAETPPVRKTRALLGGQRTVSLSDSDVQNALAFWETKHNARSNSLFYVKVSGASRVTKQVVNGYIYRFFDATFAKSNCRKNDPNLDNSQCVVSANAATAERCSSQIYWNPRQTPEYTLSSETC